jgi:hypothetical protein
LEDFLDILRYCNRILVGHLKGVAVVGSRWVVEEELIQEGQAAETVAAVLLAPPPCIADNTEHMPHIHLIQISVQSW